MGHASWYRGTESLTDYASNADVGVSFPALAHRSSSLWVFSAKKLAVRPSQCTYRFVGLFELISDHPQILFSLFFERVVFHNYPPALSLLGTVVILSSALYVAVRCPPPETVAQADSHEFTGEKPKPDDIEFQQIPSSDPDEPSQPPPVRRRPSRAFSYAAVPSGADVGFEAESPAAEGDDHTGGGDAKATTGPVDMERKEYPRLQ